MLFGKSVVGQVSCVAVSTGSAALPSLMPVEARNDLAGAGRRHGVGMDGLEQQHHLAQLAGRHMAEDVAIEMHHAALPEGLGEEFCGALDQALI